MASKTILVLGAGLVARPCVEYLLRKSGNSVTVACRNLSTSKRLIEGVPQTQAISLDVSSGDLDEQIAAHDLVIFLVPFVHHAAVIKSAIRGKTDVVTTSYVSPAVQELDAAAKEAGIVVLNEVGVDPGVDHLYAIKKIDEIHKSGGEVKEFYSYCGGLPAPECASNPLKFKFSWSPRGALLSQRNSATFLSNGTILDVLPEDLMVQAKPYFVKEGYSFLAYPNRNSVPFREFYNIPEADTVIRGSLRYDGNPAFVQALGKLGWLDIDEKEWLKEGITWAEIQQRAISAKSTDEKTLIARIEEVCAFPSATESSRIISGLKWMGILSLTPATIRGRNQLDTLCAQLEKVMMFQPGERDLVMLQHKFVVKWKDGERETLTSTLELLGDREGYSGMAKSVGINCGVASQLLLDAHPALKVPGVLAPYRPEICTPIREGVEREGIKMVEETLGTH